jgi:3-deoxy-D-manno-octulosonate 8-phosphate phosphatase (KDO 8-P phosphatase)
MNLDFRQISQKYSHKLEKIRVTLFDVDGILTNGLISWDGEPVGFNRTTHAQDGFGLKMLMEAGIKVGIISGGDSVGIKRRFIDNLGLDYVFLGSEDKRQPYLEILKMGFKNDEILYMGDELYDIPLLKKAGFSATVPNAPIEVREVVDYVTKRISGDACAREVIDILRYAQNIQPKILDFDD